MTIEDALPMTAMLAELANVRAELERTKRRLERVTTPEAERDRRVGAAVMAWECPGCGHGAAHAYSGHLCVSCELCGVGLRRVIIAALREEEGR